MDEIPIGEVARRTGVRASALRYYEEAGLLPPARRAGGRRMYPADVVRRIRLLRFAQRAGFTLAEIRTLFHGFDSAVAPGERWNALARAKIDELDDLIARATQMKRGLEMGMACGCASFDECVLPEEPTPPDSRIDALEIVNLRAAGTANTISG
ncbi:MAG TPA: MerR family transcriptional regulator [Longimicrobium sp.]